MQLRNTLVLVRIFDESIKKVGAIVISTNAEMYAEAEILAVGPGNVSAAGARVETHDLHPGQRVLVKHQDVKITGQGVMKAKTYIEYAKDDVKYQIFEQTHIVAILAQAPARNMELRDLDHGTPVARDAGNVDLGDIL